MRRIVSQLRAIAIETHTKYGTINQAARLDTGIIATIMAATDPHKKTASIIDQSGRCILKYKTLHKILKAPFKRNKMITMDF